MNWTDYNLELEAVMPRRRPEDSRHDPDEEAEEVHEEVEH